MLVCNWFFRFPKKMVPLVQDRATCSVDPSSSLDSLVQSKLAPLLAG